MKIFPAVDILGGRCVQLVQGKRESATAYGDPLSCATRWINEGATALHIVNLDGAFGMLIRECRTHHGSYQKDRCGDRAWRRYQVG